MLGSNGWLWLAVLLLLVVAGVRLDVLFSYQSNDMLTSFQVVEAGKSLAAGLVDVKNYYVETEADVAARIRAARTSSASDHRAERLPDRERPGRPRSGP